MSEATGITIDYREFDRAMTEYAAASKKDFDWICNKNLQEAAIRSIPFMRRANEGAILALAEQTKLVAWHAWRLLRKRGLMQAGGLISSAVATALNRPKIADAWKRAAAQIKARRRSISFMASFFKAMSEAMAPYTRNYPRGGQTKRGIGFQPAVQPAQNGSASASAAIRYAYLRRRRDMSKADALLAGAMQQGVNAATANMMVYVDRKMAETGRQFSAR